MNQRSIRFWILAGFVLMKFLLQFKLINPVYELHRDEFLHIDQGEHLAWGYISLPPFTSWISALILALGKTEFWVKFFPALFGALTLWICSRIVSRAGGGNFALILTLAALVFSPFTRLNMLFQPNSADVLFWTLLYYFLIGYFYDSRTRWLYFAAATFAIGMLNKYNIGFLAAGLVPALLITRQRFVFYKKHLYFAGFLAILLLIPHLYWQFVNGFPVINHMNELEQTQLVNNDRADFFKEQLLLSIGFIFIILASFWALLRWPEYKKFRFVFWSYAFTIALFALFRAKGYYALGLYPVLIAFGAVWFEDWAKAGRRRFVRPILIAVPVAMFVPFIPLVFPVRTPEQIQRNIDSYKSLGLLRWEDGKDHEMPQDFADMLGWRELAAITDSAYSSIPDADHNTLILCDNYGQAGAINFYSKVPGLRAVSFNADYINWFPEFKYNNAILIKEWDDTDRSVEIPLFESWYKAGEIKNKYAREKGTSVYVFLGAKADINKRITDEAAARKESAEF